MIVGGLSCEDGSLFEQVDRAGIKLDLPELTGDRIRELARLHGIDFATALWYRTISTLRPSSFSLSDDRAEWDSTPIHRVLVIPGAFHRHHVHTGADGARVVHAARKLGWPADVLDVPTLGPRDHNARVLSQRLSEIEDCPVVLVTLSKGAADLIYAWERPGAKSTFARTNGWLNLSGLARGSRLFDIVAAKPALRLTIKTLLWFKGARWSTLEQLRPEHVANPIAVPNTMRVLHVIGCPLRRHLRHKWAEKAYARLEALGPNDGGGILLGEMSSLPGEILPFWGVDHYLNPSFAFDAIVPRLLLHAARSATIASAMPAGRSRK